MAGDEGETFGSKTKLQNRIAKLVGQGVSPGDVAVYEKTSMTMTVKTAVTL